MPSCFIIMPITTREEALPLYRGDVDHFQHVLDHLFKPAIVAAGFDPIPPIAEGAEVIQARIITQLSEADLVLCDMSVLNPNVFFELGIRTALNKPTCMVRDHLHKTIPFDTAIVNCHSYDAHMEAWRLTTEIDCLAKHIIASGNNKEQNELWKYFGVATNAAMLTAQVTEDDKMSAILRELEGMRREQNDDRRPKSSDKAVSNAGRKSRSNRLLRTRILDVMEELDSDLTELATVLGFLPEDLGEFLDGKASFTPNFCEHIESRLDSFRLEKLF